MDKYDTHDPENHAVRITIYTSDFVNVPDNAGLGYDDSRRITATAVYKLPQQIIYKPGWGLQEDGWEVEIHADMIHGRKANHPTLVSLNPKSSYSYHRLKDQDILAS